MANYIKIRQGMLVADGRGIHEEEEKEEERIYINFIKINNIYLINK